MVADVTFVIVVTNVTIDFMVAVFTKVNMVDKAKECVTADISFSQRVPHRAQSGKPLYDRSS